VQLQCTACEERGDCARSLCTVQANSRTIGDVESIQTALDGVSNATSDITIEGKSYGVLSSDSDKIEVAPRVTSRILNLFDAFEKSIENIELQSVRFCYCCVICTPRQNDCSRYFYHQSQFVISFICFLHCRFSEGRFWCRIGILRSNCVSIIVSVSFSFLEGMAHFRL